MSELIGSPAIQATGYALVAFLWQGAAIGVLAALLALILRRATPQTRYAVGCIALTAMALAPIVTVVSRLDDRSLAASHERAATPATPASTDDAGQVLGAGTLANDPASPSDGRLAMVVLVWTVGVMLVGLHFAGGRVMVARLRRFASPVTNAIHRDAFDRLARRLSVAIDVQLLSSSRLEVPAVIGWLRPAIILPISTLAGLSPSHFEAILAHELAHVRRRDYLVNVLQCLVETLLFYHPAVWWVSGWIRREREHSCDDVAASVCESRVGYAHALRALEELRQVPVSFAMSASGGDLLGRIRRLVHGTRDPLPNWSGGLAMIVPLVAFLALGSTAGADRVQSRLPEPPSVERLAVPLSPAADSPGIPARPAAAAAAAPRPIGATRVQVTNGVTGTVTDQLGGVIPGAQVTLRSRAGQEAGRTFTNVTGAFELISVPEGDYDLVVSLSGFKTARQPVRINAGVRTPVVVRLQLGSVSEEVVVVAPETRTPPPAGAPPALLQTAADYRAAAMYYYVREAFGDAEAMIERAAELTRAEKSVADAPTAVVPAGVVRVGGSVKAPRKILNVKPIYPSAALAANIEGAVTISATIDRAGTVSGAAVTSASSPLDTAALDAVRQWLFTPTELDRTPVDVGMTVTMTFRKR